MLGKKWVLGLIAAMALGLVANPFAWANDRVHNGAASCAASTCHGSTGVAAGGAVDGNEHAVWLDGPHSKSFRTLQTARAEEIARNMGVGSASRAELCLDCHAVPVPARLRGSDYNIAEGVTCEACHGGSGDWLDLHNSGTASRDQLRNAGLFPTEDPIQRASMCLDCHFGAKDQFVGHRLMGAGHPRISFELDSYTEINAHHTVDSDYLQRKTYVDGVRTWAIGQAMSISRRMELLADNQTGTVGFFPELVFFDCHGCHAPMSVKRRDTVARNGQPKLDDSNMLMLRVAMAQADPGLSGQIDADLTALHRAAGQSRGALIGAAQRMRETSNRAVRVLASRSFSGSDMQQILRRLASDGANGRVTDYSSAEQTTLVIDSTLAAMANAGHIPESEYDRLGLVLDQAFTSVETDDGYDASRFISAMRAFEAAIQ